MNTISELKKRLNNKKKIVIQKPAALDQVSMFLEYYDVDLSDGSEDEQKAFENTTNNIINAIMIGKIEIKRDEKDVPVLAQQLSNGEILEYSNNITNARANMNFKDEKHFKTNYQFAGALCGIGEDGVRNLPRSDSKLTEQISTFFLKL